MSRDGERKFELPGKLEKILATLAVHFGREQKPILEALLVNSTYHVKEGWDYDNWNGGTYGHALTFLVPAPIYFDILKRADDIAKELGENINKISNLENEHIAKVMIELQEDPTMGDWRQASSARMLHPAPAVVMDGAVIARLWTPGYLRVFLSHKATNKKLAADLKSELALYGVSCFVAHEDIEPTREWQVEIEHALCSMEALAAVLSEDFHDSSWTDQEVGVAIGRRVPILPIRLGQDPYGFIGKYQAIPGQKKGADELAQLVYDVLSTKRVLEQRLAESLIARFEDADNFRHANLLMRRIETLSSLPPEWIDRLEKAPEENAQVAEAWDVKEKLPRVIRRLRNS